MKTCTVPMQQNAQIASLYPYDASEDASYLQRYQRLQQQQSRFRREQLVEVLRSYHTPELLHPAIERNLTRLLSAESVVVVGGQQASFLTGPLYTIYKVITIIQLARREEVRLGKPVIPVFWIAGEDHDLKEVDHLYIPNGVSMQKRVYPYEDKKKPSVSSIMLDPTTVHTWLAELQQQISDREFKPDWIALCEELTSEPISWTRFFARLLHYLFAEYGLLMIDSHDPRLREFEQPYFEQLIEQNEALGNAVERGIQNWESNGLASPLQFEANQAHLFVNQQGSRVALYREGSTFQSRNRFYCFSEDELRVNSKELSNNVATRPIMQEWVFPVLAFVGGPSEVDYWSCLGEAFSLFKLEMPIIYLRQNITIVERHIEKYKELWGISWKALLKGEGQADIEELKQKHIPPDLTEHFAGLTKQLQHLYTPFLDDLTKMIGDNISELGTGSLTKILQNVKWLEQKSLTTLDQRVEVELRQHREVLNAIYPLGGWQERSYNLITFWNAIGLDWLHMLCKQELPKMGTHQLLYL